MNFEKSQKTKSPENLSPAPDRFLRLPDVKRRTGQARATIYARIAEGTFPSAIKTGPRTVAWLESEISGWISDRIQERNNAQELK